MDGKRNEQDKRDETVLHHIKVMEQRASLTLAPVSVVFHWVSCKGTSVPCFFFSCVLPPVWFRSAGNGRHMENFHRTELKN
jgi:hypothetical protein